MLTALFPLLLIAVVGLLGRQTVAEDGRHAERCRGPGRRTSRWRSPTFWRGNPGLPVLRTTHVAAALAALAALVAWPATSLVATGAAHALGVALCIASIGRVRRCASSWSPASTATGREADRHGAACSRRSARSGSAGSRSSCSPLAAIYSAWDWPDPWAFAGRLPGLSDAVLASFCVTVSCCSCAHRHRRGPAAVGADAPPTATAPRSAGWRRRPPPGMAFLAAGGFSAGFTFRVAELFGRPVLSEETRIEQLIERETRSRSDPAFDDRLAAATGDAPLTIPPSFAWAGAATTVITFVLARGRDRPCCGSVGASARWPRRSLTDRPDRSRRADGRPTARSAGSPGRVAVARARRRRRPDRGSSGRGERRRAARRSGRSTPRRRTTGGSSRSHRCRRSPAIGTWLMGLFTLGTVALFWASYRNPAMRRTVGILWDVGCFFPRAAHPLVAAVVRRAGVPELADRTSDARPRTATCSCPGTRRDRSWSRRPCCSCPPDRVGPGQPGHARITAAPALRAVLPGVLRRHDAHCGAHAARAVAGAASIATPTRSAPGCSTA